MATEKPFFIGWESKPPKLLSGFTLALGIFAVLIGAGLAGFVASLQGNIGSGTWDLEVQEMEGLFVKSPTSMLVTSDEAGNLVARYLVSEFKFGFPEELADRFHLKQVKLQGTLIDDGTASMIEVVNGSASEVSSDLQVNPFPQPITAGNVTLRGEIVDSKCYLGVMNPGIRKTHRACAINCIQGGVPPILLAETETGEKCYVLLLGAEGEAINDKILDYVAEPVKVSGILWQEGPILVLRTDLASLERL